MPWAAVFQYISLTVLNIIFLLISNHIAQWWAINWDQFDVHKSMHHHAIQINQPTRCNNFTSLLLDVYVWLSMFRAPLRPSSGAYNCTRSLWFYHWSVAVGALQPHTTWVHCLSVRVWVVEMDVLSCSKFIPLVYYFCQLTELLNYLFSWMCAFLNFFFMLKTLFEISYA